MVVDLKLHTEKKAAEKLNDALIQETIKDGSTMPFEVQILRIRGRFMNELLEAKHRGDDPARVARAINAIAADMVMEFIMQTIPPTQPAMVVQSVNSAFKELSDMAQALADSYLTLPPEGSTPPTPANQH